MFPTLTVSVLLIPLVTGALIDNTVPRRDVDGSLMDVHDGNVIKLGDLYHWYGMGYQDCELEKGLIPPRNCPGIYLPSSISKIREN